MPFENINRMVFPLGRVGPNGVQLLGTAILLPTPGHFATAAHVTKRV